MALTASLPAIKQGDGRVRLNHGTSLQLPREALRRIDHTINGHSRQLDAVGDD